MKGTSHRNKLRTDSLSLSAQKMTTKRAIIQDFKITFPRLLPTGCDLGATDDPVEADHWKNMIFDRDGGSHLCNPVYPTERDAQIDADRCLQRLRENYPTGYRARLHDGAWVNVAEISHCIQIPWNRP